MFHLFYDHQQIPIYAIVRSSMTSLTNSKLHSILNTCRNLHFHSFTLPNQTCSTTSAARIGYHLSFPIALRTCRICNGTTEKSIYHMLNLPGTMASRTRLNVRRITRTSSPTIRASHTSFNRNLFFNTCSNLLQSQSDPSTDITPPINPFLGTPRIASATKSAKTTKSTECTSEKIIQYIIQITEAATEVRSRLPIHTRKTKLVVFCLFVRVAKHRISLRGFLELLLGGLLLSVAAIHPSIRVPLHRKLAIRHLNIVSGCIFVHTQDFIVISFISHNVPIVN